MKPSFALLLSYDGLVLSHRTTDGWLRIGEVALTAPDVVSELASLRETALGIAKSRKLGPFWTKLVLPNTEILYDTISVEGITSPDYDGVIRERLDGRTPYAMNELCYDYVVSQGEAQVAVVARETLAEAEAFAVEHGFEPICFAAVPPKGTFSGEPMFGTTRNAEEVLAPSEQLERDMAPVVIVGDALADDRAVMSPASTNAEDPPAPTTPDPSQTVEGIVAASAPVRDEASGPSAETPLRFSSARAKAAQGDGALEAAGQGPQASARPPRTRAKSPPPPKAAKPQAMAPEAMAETGPATSGDSVALSARRAAAARAPSDAPFPRIAQKRAPRPLGLLLTIGLLAVLLLVGLVSAFLDDEESTVEKAPAPGVVETADQAGVAPEPEPEITISESSNPTPATAPETEQVTKTEGEETPADRTDLNTETAETLERTGPQPSQAPVIAMTEGPEPAIPPTLQTVSRFAAVPTPEEVAEGEEAAPLGLAISPGIPTPDAAPEGLQVAQTAEDVSIEAENTRPGLIETETRYAATGVWQRSPDPLTMVETPRVDDLYLASLDREIEIEDALALPVYQQDRDLRPISPRPPLAPGQTFDLDTDGQVSPSPDGTLTPEGVLVFSDPETRPSPRPQVTPATTAEDLERAALAALRPPARPDNLIEIQQRGQLDGRSLAELRAVVPAPRPPSPQELAAADAPDGSAEGTLAASPAPESRPAGFADTVARIRAAAAEQPRQGNGGANGAAAASLASAVTTPAPVTPRAAPSSPPPTIPTTASVARQATIENAMPLNRINLIGVYGTPSSRRALIRLASGRYVKVEVGDRVDGGRVATIGETSLQYTRGGRNITLEMPRG